MFPPHHNTKYPRIPDIRSPEAGETDLSGYSAPREENGDARSSFRPERSTWPEAELGNIEEWYISDVPAPDEISVSPAARSYDYTTTESDAPHPLEGIWMFLRQTPRIGAAVVFVILGILGGGLFMTYVTANVKETAIKNGEEGYRQLALAVEDMRTEHFDTAVKHFTQAEQFFTAGGEHLFWLGRPFADIMRFIPGLSTAVSGKYALQAGERFSAAGILIGGVAEELALSRDTYVGGGKVSLLSVLKQTKAPLEQTALKLEAGHEALAFVDLSDIPEDKRERFIAVKQSLPALIGVIKGFREHEKIFEELLGGNGPRKYLFLFQNNHEMRATGGFIGSYAIMDVNDGGVRRFFVDGIFNPDGQLKEKVIPPKAIQKVSAAWSLHDSNWFPDFPVSAEKAIYFYEKTGGPTVDGVITLTPAVMQKLLAVTGPITLPQYGLTVDQDNFIPVIQEQVEVKYDRAENQPKKVLADLTTLLLEKAFALQDKAQLYAMAQAFTEGLNEKHILLYTRHQDTQALIDEAGWSGRVLPASKDYLSVIHTNINGYKTDGVIDETIKHAAEINEDGSIIDTVAITRTHRGGHTPYEWWNEVNADYLRVYVPEGSELLSAKGATWEFPEAPLDYAALGFRRDPDVEREENSILIDEKSGTRVYRDAGKTVFGAWVYVSPQESVTVEYRYRLPFRIDVAKIRQGGADSYSALYQKQSGSSGSRLFVSVSIPDALKPIWQTGGNLIPYGREWQLETKLSTDAFVGMVFGVAHP